MKNKLLTIFCITYLFTLVAEDEAIHEEQFPTKYIPWFTGPLLAPSAVNVSPGHYVLEPYLFYFVNNGVYDEHWRAHSTPHFYSTQAQLLTVIGLTKSVELRLAPQAFYNTSQGAHYTNVGDFPVGFGFQLVRADVSDPWPSAKLILRASIPIGKYQHLNPDKNKTDAIGSGSWEPTVTLAFSKLFHTAPTHYLSSRLVFTYLLGTGVHVRGFNSYGGASDTRGTVHRGGVFSVDWSVEYNFSRHWAFACDLLYTHNNKNRFSGNPGGQNAVNFAPSKEQFSLAPALEYNWTDNVGVIAGPWFTFLGRNNGRFIAGVIAVNIYI